MRLNICNLTPCRLLVLLIGSTNQFYNTNKMQQTKVLTFIVFLLFLITALVFLLTLTLSCLVAQSWFTGFNFRDAICWQLQFGGSCSLCCDARFNESFSARWQLQLLKFSVGLRYFQFGWWYFFSSDWNEQSWRKMKFICKGNSLTTLRPMLVSSRYQFSRWPFLDHYLTKFEHLSQYQEFVVLNIWNVPASLLNKFWIMKVNFHQGPVT